MSDKSNTGAPDDEKETNDLLALLYPEDGDETRESELISDDELSGMQGLRSLFRDLPEEEPSDAVTNKLMAMAAQHAPTPAEESRGFFTWFHDLFQPVFGHPGFAAAATLVVVVGVAGTLYVKGEGKLAEPTVASQAEDVSRAAPRGPETVLDQSKPMEEQAVATGTVTPDPAAVPAPEPEPDLPSAEGAASIGGLAPAKESPVESRGGSGTSARGDYEFKSKAPNRKSRSSARGMADGLASERVVSGVIDGNLDSVVASDEADDDAAEPVEVREELKAPRSAAPQRPKSKPLKKASKGAKDVFSEPPPPPASSQKPGTSKNEDAPSVSARFHAKAVAAAKRGDCEEVRALGNKIRKADSAYYDRTFLSDSRLSACRNSTKK